MEDLLWTPGSKNMGGLVGNIHAIEIDQIDLSTEPTLDADGLTITSPLVLNVDQKFATIYHTRETGKIDSNMVGERDGRSFDNMLEFFHPGSSKAEAAFREKYCNTPSVYIAKDTDGNWRLIGLAKIGGKITKDLPAYMEPSNNTTGAAAADRRGSTYVIKSEASHPPLFYEGPIDLIAPDV